MREIRFGSPANPNPEIPDAHLDPNDPVMIQQYGIPKPNYQELPCWQKDNPANEKARMMREQGIKPGTPAWFQLWFGR